MHRPFAPKEAEQAVEAKAEDIVKRHETRLKLNALTRRHLYEDIKHALMTQAERTEALLIPGTLIACWLSMREADEGSAIDSETPVIGYAGPSGGVVVRVKDIRELRDACQEARRYGKSPTAPTQQCPPSPQRVRAVSH